MSSKSMVFVNYFLLLPVKLFEKVAVMSYFYSPMLQAMRMYRDYSAPVHQAQFCQDLWNMRKKRLLQTKCQVLHALDPVGLEEFCKRQE